LFEGVDDEADDEHDDVLPAISALAERAERAVNARRESSRVVDGRILLASQRRRTSCVACGR